MNQHPVRHLLLLNDNKTVLCGLCPGVQLTFALLCELIGAIMSS